MLVLQQEPHHGGCPPGTTRDKRPDDEQMGLPVRRLPFRRFIGDFPNAELAVVDLRNGLQDGAIRRDSVHRHAQRIEFRFLPCHQKDFLEPCFGVARRIFHDLLGHHPSQVALLGASRRETLRGEVAAVLVGLGHGDSQVRAVPGTAIGDHLEGVFQGYMHRDIH